MEFPERRVRHQGDEPPTEHFVPQVTAGQLLAGHYRLIEPLGRGGMGVVWLAEDTQLQVRRALKFVPPEMALDTKARRRLEEEAIRVARLRHPHIVQVHALGKKDALCFIVMDYVPGWSFKGGRVPHLGERLAIEGPLTEAQVRDLLPPILDALDYAHSFRDEKVPKGLVHRDIKPSNILLDRNGAPMVADFGIAESIQSSMSLLTGSGPTSGTLPYMSPEALRGRAPAPTSDIYSVGILLYEMLTGDPPFITGDITYQHIHEPVPQIEGVSAKMNALIQTAVAKKPEDRWQSCAEMKAVLEGKVPAANPSRNSRNTESPVPSAPPDARPAQNPPSPRRPVLQSLVLACILLCIICYVAVRMTCARIDEKNWSAACQINTTVSYEQYLSANSTGKHRSDAESRIAELKKAAEIAQLLEEAKGAYSTLLSGESLTAQTPAQARARREAWEGYLSKYRSTQHKVAEAEKKVSDYAEAEKALAKLEEDAKGAYSTLLSGESLEVQTPAQARERRDAWEGYLSRYRSTQYRVTEAEKKVSDYAEAEKTLAKLEDAKGAYSTLLRGESPEPQTPAQAKVRQAAWEEYLSRFRSTLYRTAEAEGKAAELKTLAQQLEEAQLAAEQERKRKEAEAAVAAATAKAAQEEQARLAAEQERKRKEEEEALRVAENEQKRKKAEAEAKWKETSSDGRFKVSRDGVIWDTTTGLEWYEGPDENMGFDSAVSWVGSLSVAGGGWRMPGSSEVKGLYKKGSGFRNRDNVFRTMGWLVWAQGPRIPLVGPSRLIDFSSVRGLTMTLEEEYTLGLRAFAVRSHSEK